MARISNGSAEKRFVSSYIIAGFQEHRLDQLYIVSTSLRHLQSTSQQYFTVKFRNGSDQSWKWLKDHQGTQDGIVMLKTITSQDAISPNLEDYVQHLNPVLQWKNYRSQSPGTTLWSVEAPLEAADGEKSNIEDIKFGLPWGQGQFSR